MNVPPRIINNSATVLEVKMLYQKADIKDGQIVITESKQMDKVIKWLAIAAFVASC